MYAHLSSLIIVVIIIAALMLKSRFTVGRPLKVYSE